MGQQWNSVYNLKQFILRQNWLKRQSTISLFYLELSESQTADIIEISFTSV